MSRVRKCLVVEVSAAAISGVGSFAAQVTIEPGAAFLRLGELDPGQAIAVFNAEKPHNVAPEGTPEILPRAS